VEYEHELYASGCDAKRKQRRSRLARQNGSDQLDVKVRVKLGLAWDFTARRSNRKWVTDFTYTRTWSGVVYVAFVVDCYSRAIVGWPAATVRTPPWSSRAEDGVVRRDHTDRRVASGLTSSQRCRGRNQSVYSVRGNPCAGRDRGIHR